MSTILWKLHMFVFIKVFQLQLICSKCVGAAKMQVRLLRDLIPHIVTKTIEESQPTSPS